MTARNVFGNLALDASIGTDGTAPPTISGTGVRGWLRAIYDRLLTGVLSVLVPDVSTTGVLSVAWDGISPSTAPVGSTVMLQAPGRSAAAVSLSAFPSTSQVFFEWSLNGTDWFAFNFRRNPQSALNETTTVVDANPIGVGIPTGWRAVVAGFVYLRVRLGVKGASDPNITVVLNTSAATGATFQTGALPPGLNSIGAVAIDSSTEPTPSVGTIPVSGTLAVTITPTSGKAIRLLWIQAIPDPQSTASPVLSLNVGGVEFYRGYYIQHRAKKTGAANQALTLTSSGGAIVPYTIHYEEV